MAVGNTVVGAILRSPLHRVLSRSTALVRYRGRRSGQDYTTPVQYARHGAEVVILVGRPETKTWWHNFRGDHDLDLLVEGRWLPMTGHAVRGTDDPHTIAPLLDAYLARFPRAARALPGDTEEARARAAVVVRCAPRPTTGPTNTDATPRGAAT